jgi:lysophospholipase L1-like esterase
MSGAWRRWIVTGPSTALAAAGIASCSSPAPGPAYYVSLGDSYAVGYQPAPTPEPTSGYTAVVATGTHSRLANFGCGGATTSSILTTDGCGPPYGPTARSGAVGYRGQSQAAAAEAFVRAHRGDVRLITVSIGGNDITDCVARPDPVTCVTTAVATIQRNVSTLAQGLRSAAGPAVPIIGLTYPDVVLGTWVYPPGAPDHGLASLSVVAFKSLINPALSAAYAEASATFVDVTAATGAYTPLARTTTLAPYGTVPVAVAQVCTLTWYCARGNIHATTAGYRSIGEQILRAYHRTTKL